MKILIFLVCVYNNLEMAYKNEFDCIYKSLTDLDYMAMLLEMNDQHCESDNLDFRILFQGIQNSRKKINDDKASSSLFDEEE